MLPYQADVGGTLHTQIKAEGGYRVLDAVRAKVEPKLLCLIDEIVTAVYRNELQSGLTDPEQNSCPSTGRQEARQRSVETAATTVCVQVEEQQGPEDLQSRCVSQDTG